MAVPSMAYPCVAHKVDVKLSADGEMLHQDLIQLIVNQIRQKPGGNQNTAGAIFNGL
jgi:hypothetical protein